MSQHPLESAAAVKALAERLARIPQIAKLSSGTHDEPSTLSHSLSDIAEASLLYLQRLPALQNPELDGDALMQELIQLSHELQHMLYHLEDPRFLRQLFAPLREQWDRDRLDRSPK